MATALGAIAAREQIFSALGAIDAAHKVLRETPSDLVGNDFRLDVAERLEAQERTNRGLMYRIFGELADPPDGDGSIAKVRDKLWKRLHITPREITRRCRLAARILPRRSLTGQEIAPELPELAAAVAAGAVGDDHIRAVCQAIDVLPAVGAGRTSRTPPPARSGWGIGTEGPRPGRAAYRRVGGSPVSRAVAALNRLA